MSSRTIHRPFAAFAYILAAGVVTLAAFLTTFGGVNFGLYDSWAMRIIILADYALWITVLALAITGALRVRLLRWLVGGLVVVSMITAVLLLIGIVQDALGLDCVGFFGVQQPCINNWSFQAAFIFLNPVAFVPAVIVSATLLAVGLYDHYRKPRVTPTTTK